MLLSLKNRLILVRDPVTGETQQLALAIEPDGTLVVTDADNELPNFERRVLLTSFPTDEALCGAVSEALGSPREIIGALDGTIHLDDSVLAGLRKMPVDIFDDIYLAEVKERALILCVDMRNFSAFLCSHPESTVFGLIKDFTSNFLSCVNQFGWGCSYYKLMGDGALVIWDDTNAQTVGEALEVFDTFSDFTVEDLFRPYGTIGLAGALVCEKVFKYEISAEASQLKYRDYVGYGINLACRLQGLSRADELIVNKSLSETGLLPTEARCDEHIVSELRRLKGLRDPDANEAYFYRRR